MKDIQNKVLGSQQEAMRIHCLHPAKHWNNTQQNRAHYLYKRAIKFGWLKRQPCEVCGAALAEGHHTNYAEPYNVHWLCRKHHSSADLLRRGQVDYSRSTVAELASRSQGNPSTYLSLHNRQVRLQKDITAFEDWVMS